MRGEPSLEPYIPLLYAPTTERRRAQRGLSSKNIFRSQLSDRLSLEKVKLHLFRLQNKLELCQKELKKVKLAANRSAGVSRQTLKHNYDEVS